eukprot:g5165.t1
MIKRKVHFRLSEDCRRFVYTTDIAGAQGGTKAIPLASVESVQACPADGDSTFGLHASEVASDGRVHKFDAASPAQMRLWVKAVWDAVALRQYTREHLPLLLRGALVEKHGMLLRRTRWAITDGRRHGAMLAPVHPATARTPRTLVPAPPPFKVAHWPTAGCCVFAHDGAARDAAVRLVTAHSAALGVVPAAATFNSLCAARSAPAAPAASDTDTRVAVVHEAPTNEP